MYNFKPENFSAFINKDDSTFGFVTAFDKKF